MATQITQAHLLLVEGRDEEEFFNALGQHLGLANVQILGIAGKHNLRSNLKALTASTRFATVVSLGIVRDADNDPSATFQSICDALRSVNLPVPSKPLELIGQNPRVSVLLLPDANSPGMLEDLCLKSVGEDMTMACVEQYFGCLHQGGISPRISSKAKLLTFLASRDETTERLGIAAMKGYWSWQHPAFEEVRRFLTQFEHANL